MCGIAGVLSKKGSNAAPLVISMLASMANRGPDGAGMAVDGSIASCDSVAELRFQNVEGRSVVGHNRLAIVGGACGGQPFRSCDGRLILAHNGEIYNYKELRKKLVKHHKFHTFTDSEVIIHLLEDHMQDGDLLRGIKLAISELDGVYALAIRDERTGETALVRDSMGVRQLYYGETDDFIAFASERKALWQVGIREPTKRVLPCNALLISPEHKIQSFRLASAFPRVTRRKQILYRTLDSALEAYKDALIKSVEKRVQDLERIGIIFSGGIDSVLIAHLANKMVPEVICYTCGTKGSNDVAYSRKIAGELGLKLRVCELSIDDVERLVPEVIRVIEDSDAGQVEVALPVYGAVGLAHRDDIKVMLTGQGADELFGGYSWYPKVAKLQGYRMLRQHMIEDLSLLYKETLEREDKITMAHSVELREPYLDPEVIKVASYTDLRLNVNGFNDMFGKHVHRKLAENMGISHEIAYRAKEAAQHGSGVHSILKDVSNKRRFGLAVPSDYLDDLRLRERIGSSQRYGYLFANEKDWIAEPQVQIYLDSLWKAVSCMPAQLIRSSSSS
jgi:asparagine synthase (glutamine-hydrolysing)